MSFYVISEPEYTTSNWYNNILNGLIEEKRQKRFSLIMLTSMDDLKHHTITDEDTMFVIGTNEIWLTTVIQVCESYFDNRVILLGNHEKDLYNGKYSVITSDISRDILILYDYLTSYGKNRIALYGINPDSSSDAFRKKIFLSCGGREEDLFYNHGSLSKCYKDFLRRADEFDAVICTNDFAAISLVRFMTSDSNLFVASSGGGTLLAHYFSPCITHTWIDYQSFGKVGLDLCRLLQKNKNISSVTVYLSSSFTVGSTTENLPMRNRCSYATETVHKDEDSFYSDSEINEMLRIEALLNSCAEDEFKLLNYLLDNMSYAQIAEKMFLSTNGVKYKLKNMFHICKVSTKKDFLELVNKYIKNI